MKKPNFFLVGAPRCGTTTLYKYLGAHPQVYLPKIKEPKFFNPEADGRRVDNLEDYLRLFAVAPKDTIAVGEASTCYARSAKAIKGIANFVSDPKIIFMVRSPSEIVVSLHKALYLRGIETAPLEAAWSLQDQRRAGVSVPIGSSSGYRFEYSEIASIGSQVRMLLDTFGRDRLLIVRQIDIECAPERVATDFCKFLNVEPFYIEFGRYNRSVRHRTHHIWEPSWINRKRNTRSLSSKINSYPSPSFEIIVNIKKVLAPEEILFEEVTGIEVSRSFGDYRKTQ